MTEIRLQKVFRLLTAVMFATTGILHLLKPALFVRIVPPIFPRPLLLVRISGGCEITGALGLLLPQLRRAAGWGLIALLIAVFPANVYMAASADRFSDLKIPVWALWLRLPLQPIFIAIVWWVGIQSKPIKSDAMPI